MVGVELDLPRRIERRYVMLYPDRFISALSQHAERVIFSDNEYVQTIYFNNEEHAIPFGHSLKARRYIAEPPKEAALEDDGYFLDLKILKGVEKQKTRIAVGLREAMEIANKIYPSADGQLRPFMMVVYHRNHYKPKNASGARITIDDALRYFYFPPNSKEGIEIGREDYPRVEIKQEKAKPEFDSLMERVLRGCEAFPIISKKFRGYNFLCWHHTKTSGNNLVKELKGCEIEAKLEADSEDVFRMTKQLFRNGVEGFVLPPHFDFTFESASINRYYGNEDGVFKAMLRGNKAEIVVKRDSEIVKDPLGLDFILKRKEKKGVIVALDSEMIRNAQLKGELHRMRKAFWVDNVRTGRTYHISLDRCTGEPGILYEMEIEYTAIYKEMAGVMPVNENEIIADIAFLTKAILDNVPGLRPSVLTKQGWLGAE